MAADVLAPSDLAHTRRRTVTVGGRVIDARGPTLVLADALASVRVTLENAVVAEAGDLVVVRGSLSRGRIVRGRLLERRAIGHIGADAEFARLVFAGVGPRLEARSRALAVIREVFRRQRFVEVDTPLRVQTPGLDLHVDALSAQDGYLITSPEHHMKRLLAGGLPRIYQLSHCFRAEEHGALHEPEFMMLEWYRAFSGQSAIMADTERVVSAVVRELCGSERLSVGSRRVSVRPPFRRLTVREAFRRFAGIEDAVALANENEDRFFELLVERVEPGLADSRHPVFLCDYPLSQASLARPSPSDPTVAERFELYLAGVELSNGFGELTDPTEQRRRFQRDRARRRALGRPLYHLDERFLAALAQGMPAAGGNALGVDRLIALALGQREIAGVMPFPHVRR